MGSSKPPRLSDRLPEQDIPAAGEMKPVFITVRSSSIESVVYQSNGQPVQEGSYPDVEGLFELVRDAISLKYEDISVTFDPQLGYPTSAWLSWDRRSRGWRSWVHCEGTSVASEYTYAHHQADARTDADQHSPSDATGDGWCIP